MSANDVCLSDEVVAALAAGEGSTPDALAHLERCDSCRVLVSAACAHRTGGTAKAEGESILAGTLVGHYRIERPIGSGGMGVVYLARDTKLDRDVAVKLLHATGERAHERLVRESQALAKLNHPNVVTVHEVGRHGNASYLVMEHVAGGTVREWVASARRHAADIAAVYAQAARGLAAAHAAGLVHRDVKPDNVLVGNDGRVRVSDFGLVAGDAASGIPGTGLTQGGAVIGTPRYMAPEVREGSELADALSDEWSLCASLRESLRGDDDAAVEPPAWLRRVLDRGLAVDPDLRFPSLDALAGALVPARRSRWLAAPIVGAIAIVAAVSVAFAGTQGEHSACGHELDAAWNPARRVALAQHLGTLDPRGGDTFRSLSEALDVYAALWTVQRRQVCHADPGDSTAARAAACLDRRSRAFDTLVGELLVIDRRAVEHSRAAVDELPALQDCTATERLAGRQPEPGDPVSRARLAELERRYDVARTRSVLRDRKEDQLAELRSIAEGAESLGYDPLVADALSVVGMNLANQANPDAMTALRRAQAAAQAGGDERQIAQTGVVLVTSAAILHRPDAEVADLRLQAAAALKRLKWRHDPMATAAEAELEFAFGRDDFEHDRPDDAERELQRSIDLLVQQYGPHSHYLALPRTTLGKLLSARGEYDRAAALLAAPLDEADETWKDLAGGVAMSGSEAMASFSMVEGAYELFDIGRDGRALELVHRARAALPADGQAKALEPVLDDLEAEIEVARGRFAEARVLNDRCFVEIGQASPQDAAGYHQTRGSILEGFRDFAGAEREYREALDAFSHELHAVDGDLQTCRVGLARTLAARGHLAEARKLIESVVADDIVTPRLAPRAWLLAADLRWRTGDRKGARQAAAAARASLAKLPELVNDAAAVDRWSAAHEH